MSGTVERNNKFYEQHNGEMLTENEQLKEWLVIANKHNDELQKEKDMYKTSFETMSENYFKLENIIKEVREKVENFDVFKEFTFPLMKKWEEQEVKSSIDYEWNQSIKKPILEILDKENK